MGKWSSMRRAAGQHAAGVLAPPGPTEWQIDGHTPTTITAERLVSRPLGCDGVGTLAVPVATGTPATLSPPVALQPVLTGLVSGTAYRVYMAWYSGSVRVSEWSAAKLDTTP